MDIQQRLNELNDPLTLGRLLWPHVRWYEKEVELIYSVRDAVETYCVAGNKLGKDFAMGFVATTFTIAPQCYFPREYVRQIEAGRAGRPMWLAHARRCITTSVKSDHLDVLWGEIAGFVRTSALPLDHLSMVHHEIRFKDEQNSSNPFSYLKGQTTAKGEGMAGHHAPYTLAIGDEASGLDDEVYKQFQGWAKRMCFITNPNPTNNFVKANFRQGDLRIAG